MNKKRTLLLITVAVCSLMIAGIVLAQGSLQIERSVFSSGGSTQLNGGSVGVSGAIGQPIVGQSAHESDSISLAAGLFFEEKLYQVYVPLMMR